MIGIKEYRNKLERKKGERDKLLKQQAETIELVQSKEKQLILAEKAQAIIQTTAHQTQQELQYHISELITLSLHSVFPDPYSFELNFNIKRGRTEVEPVFIKDNHKINPIYASGLGVVDIAAFALRIALWNVQQPKSRNTIILDEPFKFLSKDLVPNAARMLVELSGKLGLQIILVTHIPELIETAHKKFKINICNGVSQVKEM